MVTEMLRLCFSLKGNPGTDGIPGSKGSAVSIFFFFFSVNILLLI